MPQQLLLPCLMRRQALLLLLCLTCTLTSRLPLPFSLLHLAVGKARPMSVAQACPHGHATWQAPLPQQHLLMCRPFATGTAPWVPAPCSRLYRPGRSDGHRSFSTNQSINQFNIKVCLGSSTDPSDYVFGIMIRVLSDCSRLLATNLHNGAHWATKQPVR